jgi:hypothetical protein
VTRRLVGLDDPSATTLTGGSLLDRGNADEMERWDEDNRRSSCFVELY